MLILCVCVCLDGDDVSLGGGWMEEQKKEKVEGEKLIKPVWVWGVCG